jgi:predicted NBD/HSP70 family sugar kinase
MDSWTSVAQPFERKEHKSVITRFDAIGQRSETVRRSNLSAIVRELHRGGPASRSELVARTGLTRSAIRGLIGELAAADLVTEERARPRGSPGRPSPVVRLDPTSGVVLALEIAIDTLAAAVVGLGGTVLELARIDRPSGHTSVAAISADLAELAETLRARRPADEPLLGVGVAVVGVVRRSDGFVSMAPNLGWRDVPLGEWLARALDLPVPIAVANDADLGVLVEHRRGAAIGADHVLFISGEYGVGGGVIVDGLPLTGVAGYAGEVGHMPINPNGTACRCGSIGCWETEVGEAALLRLAGRPTGGGGVEVDAVLREADAGSPAALTALDHVGRWLGIGLAGLINIFDPELIVLGGTFGRIHPFIAEVLEAELDRRALAGPRRLVRIVPAILGADAPLLGAAELAFEPLLADPAAWLPTRGAFAVLASA